MIKDELDVNIFNALNLKNNFRFFCESDLRISMEKASELNIFQLRKTAVSSLFRGGLYGSIKGGKPPPPEKIGAIAIQFDILFSKFHV